MIVEWPSFDYSRPQRPQPTDLRQEPFNKQCHDHPLFDVSVEPGADEKELGQDFTNYQGSALHFVDHRY